MVKRKVKDVNYAESASDNEDSKPLPQKRKSLKQSQCSDDSDIDDKPSAYELLRLKNIEERENLLRSLGIGEALGDLKELVPSRQNANKKTPRIKVAKEALPMREPSRRIRNLAAQSLERVKKDVEEEVEEEFKDERFKDVMPMKVEGEESEKLFKALQDIKIDIKCGPDLDLKTCDLTSFQKCLMCLRMHTEPVKVVTKRIQSICVHPATTKHLVIAGDTSGQLGLWDIESETVATYQPHQGPLNCISVSTYDSTKIFTTGHDGAFVNADLEAQLFVNVYATDLFERYSHLTWHDQVDANRFLLSHGNGKVGVLDIREPKIVNTWIPCFERSARTVQHHPSEDNYFLVSSGAGSSCNVYDIRSCSSSRANPVSEMNHPKGLTSGFFSPSGEFVLTTCNDDHLRIYSSPLDNKPILKKQILHNNHTGRWLSVFKAMWHPARNDAFTIGSLLSPRRLQIYGLEGKLVAELRNNDMTTISPVISSHPTVPFIVGGNSSGRIHAFTYSSQN